MVNDVNSRNNPVNGFGPAPGTPQPVVPDGGSTRRIVVAGMSTVTVLVLLFSYHTSTEGAAGNSSVAAAQVSASTTAGSGAATGSGAAATSFTGSSVDTRWGPVQVRITVSDGRITAVDVVEHPTGNGRDQQINAQALPVLVQEALAAQSADIDMVSGATVTSTGYVQSLQSALDQAGL